eukprot:TRINITY_DN430_c1_g1_i2.p1 TRINITY_DN430_c1_g1~~TRINITY_DN430_c1_g1_i2.p1  ORF type:complete len:966 (-),score=166.34 TRINITY_DN430_c1_g1_i2:23-2920(-)
MTMLLKKEMYSTPLFGYELLDNVFGCKSKFKMENLQRYGDSSPRGIASIILSNYENQRSSLQIPFSNVAHVVLVLNSDAIDVFLDAVALLSKFTWNKNVVVFCTKHSLSPMELVQIYHCKLAESKFIVQGNTYQECFQAAKHFASQEKAIFIDSQFSYQFSLIGLATVANEIIETQENTETLIIPSRLFTIGSLLVGGVSIFVKKVKPATKIILARLTEEENQGLFPDILQVGWKSNVHKDATLHTFFEHLDANNDGLVDNLDTKAFIREIFGQNWEFQEEERVLGFADFNGIVTEEYKKAWEEMPICGSQLTKYLSEESLIKQNFLDQVVSITETEAGIAFMRCLEYTHTQADGRGVLSVAALWNKKLGLDNQQNVVGLISGGFMDLISFQTLLDYCLALSGYNFSIHVQVPDTTRSVSKLLQILGANNISVYDVTFDRTGNSSVYGANVIIQCLSKGFEQQNLISQILIAQGYKASIKSAGTDPSQPPNLTIFSSPVCSKSKTDNPYVRRDINQITPQSIHLAWERIKGNALRTPTYPDKYYSQICGCKIYLKFENIQKTGSFKIRGSSNMVLRVLEGSVRPKGLVAASAGNHSQGVALVSYKLGLPCAIVCPTYAPDGKLNYTKKYGAEVFKVGSSLEESAEYAEKICKERDWLFVKPFNDVDIIEGQGTMGLEIFEDVPDIDTVLVNVGGGGMIAGIALYLKTIKPKIRIIGVQSEVVAPLLDYKKTELLRPIPVGTTTLADGVNVRIPGGVHNEILRDLVDEYVSVSENEIASTIVNLLSSSRTLSEGAGCLGLAALIHKKVEVKPEEKVCVLLCGGNLDMSTLKQIYEYGLRSLGRFFSIHLTSNDSPGNLSKIISLATQSDLKLQDVKHIRGVGDINWNEVTITISFYSNSFKQQIQFLKALVKEGRRPTIVGREFIKDHELIYEPFDNLLKEKINSKPSHFLPIPLTSTTDNNKVLS